jgi:hypothetical protein
MTTTWRWKRIAALEFFADQEYVRATYYFQIIHFDLIVKFKILSIALM